MLKPVELMRMVSKRNIQGTELRALNEYKYDLLYLILLIDENNRNINGAFVLLCCV